MKREKWIIAMYVNELIKEERKKNTILQKELAQVLGVSKKIVSDWENFLAIPNEEHTIKMATFFNVPQIVFLEARLESIETKRNLYCVYKHTSPSGKVYIGITSQNIKKRWQYGGGYEGNRRFTNAIKKYGWDSFSHEILFENITESEAKDKEIELISYYKSCDRKYGYNVSPGGDIISEESKVKAKITREQNGISSKESLRMKERWADPEIRAETILKMKNKPRTEEQKQHYRDSSARKGKPLPDGVKAKLSKKAKMKTGILSARSRAVVAINPFTGAIEKEYVSAREAAIAMKDKSISAISNACRGEGNKSGYKHGFFWSWKDDYYEGKFPILSKDDITSKGKLKRKKEDCWNYGKKMSEKQKKIISDAHRRPVMCIETGQVFRSLTEAGIYCNCFPETISRQIRGKQKTAGGYSWRYVE